MNNRIKLVLIMLISLLVVSFAFASTETAETIVGNANNVLFHLIEVTKEQADKLIANGATEEDINKLGKLMVFRAEKITSGVTNALDQLGVAYEIYFIEVTLECEDFSLTFYVDPIKIVDD